MAFERGGKEEVIGVKMRKWVRKMDSKRQNKKFHPGTRDCARTKIETKSKTKNKTPPIRQENRLRPIPTQPIIARQPEKRILLLLRALLQLLQQMSRTIRGLNQVILSQNRRHHGNVACCKCSHAAVEFCRCPDLEVWGAEVKGGTWWKGVWEGESGEGEWD